MTHAESELYMKGFRDGLQATLDCLKTCSVGETLEGLSTMLIMLNAQALVGNVAGTEVTQ